MKIMISACLAGENCKYNGGNNRNEKVLRLMAENEVITVCPDHIAENYDIFDFELSEDEMDRIRGIDEQRRYEHW